MGGGDQHGPMRGVQRNADGAVLTFHDGACAWQIGKSSAVLAQCTIIIVMRLLHITRLLIGTITLTITFFNHSKPYLNILFIL